jgi:hypothetical protein
VSRDGLAGFATRERGVTVVPSEDAWHNHDDQLEDPYWMGTLNI